ncbi:DUF5675 family protein [Daejeonella oryzae]|uniref:DUF5675 family protein n=1 Tax=Daejeonella oryzae TaxID=1122943 RepID=UPI0004035A9D|nr:DUF5675 family protein [Daejeonella oryzae]
MELTLIRNYHSQGVNGVIFFNGTRICESIELPWQNNVWSKSCIPEGKYFLSKRSSPKYGSHLWIRDVPGRELILIHPANDALKELRGCIAPVSKITGPGTGILSRQAMRGLLELVRKETIIYLNIRS